MLQSLSIPWRLWFLLSKQGATTEKCWNKREIGDFWEQGWERTPETRFRVELCFLRMLESGLFDLVEQGLIAYAKQLSRLTAVPMDLPQGVRDDGTLRVQRGLA